MTSLPPKVTGLSPLEGPPGTKITIRGENLGVSQKDVIGLTICGADCLMYAEWKQPSKIVARSSSGMGRGDVVVTTATGGKGTCTVQFRGIYEPIGPTIESAIWIDESHITSSSFGHSRSTSPLQLHPEDPLGLSDEGNVGRFPVADLQELFPGGSGNLHSENFSPAWYLLENHHGTSFVDLKAGLTCLRRKVTQHKTGPASFLKSNVIAIIDCLDILGSLQTSLVKDKQELGTDLTNRLEDAIIKPKEEANLLFEDVLSRKDKADSTRNALGVLQRFRFLFNLPANIERNIHQGDYDVVINDYARAKFLFQDTEVAVFRKVYQDVEQTIDKFRSMLLERLKQLPASVEEQKKLIRHLINLETPGSPAWICVTNMYNWLSSSINNLRDEHLALSEEVQTNPGQIIVRDGGLDTPEVVQFVEDITDHFGQYFPEFWKIGHAYMNGDLHPRETSDTPDRNGKTRQHSFNKMVDDITLQVCNLIRSALLPSTSRKPLMQHSDSLGTAWPKSQSGEMLGPWLPHCIRCIRQCYSTLLKLDLPLDVQNYVQQLLFDLRVHSMICLFHQATEDIQNLHSREVWLVEMDDQRGSTTQLPLLFENRVVETLQLIRENVLQCGPKETEVFSQINIQATIKQLSQALLQAFTQALQYLASGKEEFTNDGVENESDLSFTEEQRILIVLCNCEYTSKFVLGRLEESFRKHGYPDMSMVIKGAQTKFNNLEKNLFEEYIKKKCDPVVGKMELDMYLGKHDWMKCPPPREVSIYIKEIIINMLEVHAEVYSMSPKSMNQVMTKLVESVVKELARLFECVKKFGRYGNMQANLDIRALEDTISSYATNSTGMSFMVCRSKLEPFSDLKDRSLIEDLLKEFKRNMSLQLLPFKEDTSVISV